MERFTPLERRELETILHNTAPRGTYPSSPDWDCSWREALCRVQNLSDVDDYLNTLTYDRGRAQMDALPYDSFAKVHDARSGCCWEYAVASAALASQLGYRPLVLILGLTLNGKEESHAEFVYPRHGRWGTKGRYSAPPVMESLDVTARMLARLIGQQAMKEAHAFGYAVIDLQKEFGDRWLDSGEDLHRDLAVRCEVRR